MNKADYTHLFATLFSLLLLISTFSSGFAPAVGASPAPEGSFNSGESNALSGEMFSQTENIDAEIVDITHDSGIHKEGDPVRVTVTLENTGSESNRFYIGFSVQSPSGEWFDGDNEASAYLRPGDKTTTDVIWYVNESAEPGMYDSRVSAWEESNPDNLQNRVADNQKSDAFEVETQTEEYLLSADADGNGGFEVYPPGLSTTSVDREYEEGTDVELTATPGSDSRFVEWSGDIGSADKDDATIEVTMNEARDLTAKFEEESQEYRLEADANGNGGFEVNPPGFSTTSVDREYEEGTTVELTATPDSDSRFVEWSGDIGSADEDDATIEVTMNEDRDLTAKFEEESQEYRLEADANGNGGFEVYPPGLSTSSVDREYEEGTNVELTATPGSDSRFVEWSGDIGSADEDDATIEVTMNEAHHITAVFERVESTEIDAEIVDVNHDSGIHKKGDPVRTAVTVENTGSEANRFYLGFNVQNPSGQWLGGDDEASVYLRPGDRTTTDVIWYVDEGAEPGMYDSRVSAWKESNPDNLQNRVADDQESDAFEVKTQTEEYRLRADTDGEGGFRVNPPGISTTSVDRVYEKGDDIELTATSGSDSQFVEWNGDIGSADENDATIGVTMNEARDITAVFESTEIDAEVTEFNVNSGEYEYGESIEATAIIKNTGSTEHTYFVGYSVFGSDNDKHNTGRTITLASGAETSVTLEWTAQQNSTSGEYDAQVSVWKESNQDNLQSRLDSTSQDDAFSLVQAGGPLKVRVQESDGDPISDATVSIDDSQATSTDDEGIVEFSELSSGTYELTISREGYTTQSTTVTVEDGQQQAHEITLSRPGGSILSVDGIPDEYQPGAKIKPIVTLRNTGDSEATFELTMATPSGIEAQTNPTQTVTLAPGAETTIEYTAELYGTDTDRTVQFELATANGDAIDSFSKRVEYTDTVLSVQVLDSTDTPVEEATVSVLSETNSTQTNSEGRARLTSLVPGEHLVEITPPGITSGEQTVTVDVTGGERTETTVRIDRVGTVSGTVVDQGGEPLSNGLVTINGQSAFINEDGTFSFETQFAAGKSYTIDVTQNGNSLYRQDISISPGPNDITLTVETDNNGSGGWQIIDNTNKGAVLGEVGIQMGVQGSQTLEYHAGWLGLSMVPVADAPADIRDCVLAPNDGLATNGLDCGGAAASTIGSAGTVIGVLTSGSGAGVAVAGGSFALDTAEDIGDAAKVTLSVARNVPSKINEWAEILISKVGSDKISKVLDEIGDPTTKNTLRKSVDKIRLQRAGFSGDEAAHLNDVLSNSKNVNTDELASVAGKVDDPISEITRVTKHQESGEVYALTKGEYDAAADKGYGWEKIQGKHLDNSDPSPGVTTFDRSKEMTETELQNYLTQAVRNGKVDPEDPNAIVWNVPESVKNEYGFERIRVIVSDSNNQITTAYPQYT